MCPWLFRSTISAAPWYQRATAMACSVNVAGSNRPARVATSSPVSTSMTVNALSSEVGLPSAGSATTT